MVMRYGMDEKLGHVAYEGDRAVFLNVPPAFQKRHYSEDTAREIDRAVRETVDKAFRKAVGILEGRSKTLEEGAQMLLQKETLVEEDLRRLAGDESAARIAF